MNILQKNAFKLQFITHTNDRYDYLQSAELALNGGCRWIQLRMKEAAIEEVERVALQLIPLCKEKNAVFILDDHVELCKKVGADGVHLGKLDMDPAEARKILGDDFIIGGTCNTFEDIEKVAPYVDYIGCGPFRFTQTKKKLAPVLGIEGYQSIICDCIENNITVPIVAIGGITLNDVPEIIESGLNGIAISGAILNAEDPIKETDRFLHKIEKKW